MLVIVKTPFVGHGFNMPNPGELLDVPDGVGSELVGLGVADRYEVKIMPAPEVKKKIEPSESSQADPVPRKRTLKRSRKSAKKSS